MLARATREGQRGSGGQQTGMGGLGRNYWLWWRLEWGTVAVRCLRLCDELKARVNESKNWVCVWLQRAIVTLQGVARGPMITGVGLAAKIRGDASTWMVATTLAKARTKLD